VCLVAHVSVPASSLISSLATPPALSGLGVIGREAPRVACSTATNHPVRRYVTTGRPLIHRETLRSVREGTPAPSLARPKIVTLLEGCLVEIRCEAGEVLHGRGKPVKRIVFPATCLVSLTVRRYGCAPVGIGMVAWGGATGLGPVLTPTVDSDMVATVEIGGTAWALAAEDAARLNDTVPEIHHAFVGLALAQLNEVSAHAFALGRLGIPARLAWWLLRASAACRQDSLRLTHHRLAALIGARRSSVTTTLAQFEYAGAVHLHRQKIEITNREALASFVGSKSAAHRYQSDGLALSGDTAR
jgi:hypothetical protein